MFIVQLSSGATNMMDQVIARHLHPTPSHYRVMNTKLRFTKLDQISPANDARSHLRDCST